MGIMIVVTFLVIIFILAGIFLFFKGLITMGNNEKESEKYLQAKKNLKTGLVISITAVVVFIIGFSICLSTFSLGSMR